MADGSEEKTVDKSTDELLAETDDLLSDLDGGGESARESDAEQSTRSKPSTAEDDGGFDLGFGSESASTQAEQSQEPESDGEGWRGYFNPKSFLLATLLLTVGYVGGGFVPVLGALASWAGLVGAAFLYGLGTSKGRYPETALAGAGVGLVTTVLTSLRFIAFANGQLLLVLGAGLGLVGALVGYYFGSDLRKGLTSDPDEFEDDLSW
jgi:MFS family permease